MKYANNKINIVSVVFLAATLYSCSAQDESLNLAKFQNSVQTNSQIADSTTATSNDIAFSDEIRSFEENYTKSMGSNSGNSVLLFGYKTMNVTGKDKEVLEWQCRKYKKEIEEQKGIFVAPDYSFYRIYFPMSDAIVNFNETEMHANAKGIVALTKAVSSYKSSHDSISIVGRVKTDGVSGCGSNLILKDKILLKTHLHPSHSTNNFSYVFDMGAICCGESRSVARSQASCTVNHLPYKNCSDAFMIWGNNCVQRKDVCMDFNGYGSDCVKGPKTYFVGSDCQKAMLQGHCWNEIMN